MYSSSTTQGDQTSGTFNGAKIYFCHTSRSALSTTFADNYSGNTPTLMLSRSALSMNWTMGQWNEIPLDETFAYNGTDNLLIEIQWTSSGSSLLAGATGPASQNALLGTYGASSGSTYYRSVFQLHYTTPVEPIVWHTDYQVDSGDGIVDPGETIAVSSWLRSVGTTANSLQATLSSTSGWCSVTQPNWSAGTMNMGATVDNSGSPFQIAVNADAPKGANLGLTLSLTANSGAYTVDYPLSVSVTPPIFELESYLINDFAGDGNLALNPDERVQLLFSITNSGSSASSVNAILTSSSPHVTIISDASPMGAMAKLGTGNNRSAPFAFLISTDAGLNREYPFSIRLSYDGGQSTDINCGFRQVQRKYCLRKNIYTHAPRTHRKQHCCSSKRSNFDCSSVCRNISTTCAREPAMRQGTIQMLIMKLLPIYPTASGRPCPVSPDTASMRRHPIS